MKSFKNCDKLIDIDFCKELDRFSFMVKKRVISIYAGARVSIKEGKGIDTVDYREYFPGDDIKSIAWKVYSRTEKLYIRRFEEEKNLTTHILVDCSKSMEFGEIKKFDYAAMIGAGFAYLVTNENERFALSTYSDELKDIMQPRRGKRHFLDAVELLNSTSLEGKTRLNVCADQYSKIIRSRSLVIIISDFLEPLSSLDTGIYKIARGSHDLVLIQVLDPKEKNLEGVEGDTKLYDSETSEMRRTYISPAFKANYKKILDEHAGAIKKVCDDVGADFYSITSDTPIFDAFLEIIEHS
ncbi:MAG: DUF58 domain-containing protein [Euryarchaeota archaeon]|nr:DUF58 domain-containing protein [Euryarchaeota archaeon]